ncbi:hypothetical protein BD414DRAFT_465006 [Trametes punicea]|nr:hypothetical protein BD414DRAFT_465006 [Trametes punicea]
MFAKSALSVFYLLAACALIVHATAVEDRAEKRQVGSIIDSLTSDAGSILSQGTAGAGSALSAITSVGGGIATILTSIGGEAATIITSAGGEAITLAPSGVGVVTSFAGSHNRLMLPRSAPGSSATTTSNAALGMHTFSVSAPLMSGLATVLASMFFGAWVTL